MPGGRPTEYKPEYCDMLIEHMSKGLSFESFAGLVGIAARTLYSWTVNAEFHQAKEIGRERCRLFWEQLGVAGAAGKVQGFNSSAYGLNMRNRFNWTDKVKIEHSGEVEIKDGRLEILRSELVNLLTEQALLTNPEGLLIDGSNTSLREAGKSATSGGESINITSDLPPVQTKPVPDSEELAELQGFNAQHSPSDY